jgi:hypothetical protein
VTNTSRSPPPPAQACVSPQARVLFYQDGKPFQFPDDATIAPAVACGRDSVLLAGCAQREAGLIVGWGHKERQTQQPTTANWPFSWVRVRLTDLAHLPRCAPTTSNRDTPFNQRRPFAEGDETRKEANLSTRQIHTRTPTPLTSGRAGPVIRLHCGHRHGVEEFAILERVCSARRRLHGAYVQIYPARPNRVEGCAWLDAWAGRRASQNAIVVGVGRDEENHFRVKF